MINEIVVMLSLLRQAHAVLLCFLQGLLSLLAGEVRWCDGAG